MASLEPFDEDAFIATALAELDSPEGKLLNDEDEFVDASEHQAQDDTAMEDLAFEQSNNPAAGNGYHEAYTPSTSNHVAHPTVRIDNDLDSTRGQQDEKAYNPYAPFQSRPTHYNHAAEPAETINVNKTSASAKHTEAYRRSIFKKSPEDTSQGQHSSGCSGTRGASTPPPTPPHQPISTLQVETKAEPKQEEKVWAGPDDLRDISKAIRREKRWHEKVAPLHPPVALTEHRYWIGVLNPAHAPRNACKEAHFTWMKGNRLTTVETVRRVYANTTMHEGVFLMGGERPEDGDKVEELDLFNDKIVLFTIVDEGTPASVGRLITEGLVTNEVIELDDD